MPLVCVAHIHWQAMTSLNLQVFHLLQLDRSNLNLNHQIKSSLQIVFPPMREIVFRDENKDLVNAGLAYVWLAPALLDLRVTQQVWMLKFAMAAPLR